ncbi:hypothetical protein [Acidovorax soli]|uniref:Uncharacterized protein n=1 Tax=Acidovorax soli TaxID=592050 RepID=A0A1H3VFV8_9BURK|nr:hypothetical protein [Acidovorax soli]SDZ73697.1 hypothetical protein SAMN05421875_101117 [Acidovorax soli]
MHVITEINGRGALPVRAIPLLTDWRGLTPDGLAQILAGDSDYWPSFDDLKAYRLHSDGSIEAIPPRWWRSWVVDILQAISHTIKANQTSHETGRQQWRCASLAQLPACVFVWRDEFETAHAMEYGPEGARARGNPEGFDPSVHILNFNPHPDPAIATQGMVLEGFNRAADGRPFDFPLTPVDANRWQRLGELTIEEAAFVVAGFEPPPLKVIRYQPIQYQERPGKTWARPDEYADFVRAATSAIERGIVSARSKIQDMYTVQLVKLFDVLEWAEATGFTVRLKLDRPRPVREIPEQSVETNTAAEPAQPQAAAPAPVVAASASNAPVVPFKKSALVAAHVHEWPTIERDISDAKANGLATAAKAGTRGWREADALTWARAKGKLISAAKTPDSLTQAMHNLGKLPRQKHTMQG